MLIGVGDEGGDADIEIDADGDGIFDGDIDPTGLDALKLLSVRGIIAFLVVFGWVGYGMSNANVSLWLTILVSFICGISMMVALAFFVRGVMKLRNDGNIDNRNAIGVSGKVYLTVPAERKGEGKVNVMLHGTYVERDAVTDDKEDIHTGCEIVVTGLSGQTALVVTRK
jgi:membrane protein implicated in regulation of membrane protease activity